MKKIVVLLLALLLTLSACGRSAEDEENARLVEKYRPLINDLEHGLHEHARSVLEELDPWTPPEPTEEPCTEVKITRENWQEYLELVYFEKWSQTPSALSPRLDSGYYIRLQPKYALADTKKNQEAEITVFFNSKQQVYDCLEFDLENRTYEIGEEQQMFRYDNDGDGRTDSVKAARLNEPVNIYRAGTVEFDELDQVFIGIIEKFEFLGAEGTIYLKPFNQ